MILGTQKEFGRSSGLWTGFRQTNTGASPIKFKSLALIELVRFDHVVAKTPRNSFAEGARCRDRAPSNSLPLQISNPKPSGERMAATAVSSRGFRRSEWRSGA